MFHMRTIVVLNVIGFITSVYLLALDFGHAFGPLKAFCEVSAGTCFSLNKSETDSFG